MRRIILCTALAMPVTALPILSGCDREVASEKQVEVKDDGTVETEETTVTETAEGGVKTEETKEVKKVD